MWRVASGSAAVAGSGPSIVPCPGEPPKECAVELDGKLPPAIDAEPREILVFTETGPKFIPNDEEKFTNVPESRLQYATLLHQIDEEIKDLVGVAGLDAELLNVFNGQLDAQ
eukprot:Skav228259  [mRNA]  locus=scaffold3031:143316:145917:+ [translate_table: standard]